MEEKFSNNEVKKISLFLDENEKRLREITLVELNLSSRALNVLLKTSSYTAYDVVRMVVDYMNEHNLKDVCLTYLKNCGKKTENEIKSKFRDLNLLPK